MYESLRWIYFHDLNDNSSDYDILYDANREDSERSFAKYDVHTPLLWKWYDWKILVCQKMERSFEKHVFRVAFFMVKRDISVVKTRYFYMRR